MSSPRKKRSKSKADGDSSKRVAEANADQAKTLSHAKSSQAFAKARELMPGGVSSPVRAYQSVGMEPVFIKSGKGAHVTDVDGHTYIDYVGSYGPLILGHADDAVVSAISKAAARGATFGMPTESETLLAQQIVDAVPSIEMVRFVNSGTESAMSAIRLARAATKRSKVIKCIGCYHGHSDALLVQAGSGAATLGVPSSPGVPEMITGQTLLVPFNDLDAVEKVLLEHGDDVACMAVEPIAGNMGCVPPGKGYLQGLRALCDHHGVLLLFDEVMTGFRVGLGGAQKLYGVTPDLTCLGKIVGGGLPCAAYGGRADLMQQVAPAGPVYQAGTLSGNPLAMAAGLATLESLSAVGVYPKLETITTRLASGLREAASAANIPVQVQRVGSMISVFFTEHVVHDYADASQCDSIRFASFFRKMVQAGVLLPPSQYETWFVSLAHDEAVIDATIEAARSAMAELSDETGKSSDE